MDVSTSPTRAQRVGIIIAVSLGAVVIGLLVYALSFDWADRGWWP